jgi:hypothetical protein
MKTKKYFLFIIIFLSAFSFSQKKIKIKGSKEVSEKTIILDSIINSLVVGDNLDIKISFNNAYNSIKIVADDNLLDIVDISTINSSLDLSTMYKIKSKKKFEIYLNLVSINDLRIRDNVKITQIGSFDTQELNIIASGDSQLNIDVDATKIKADFIENSSGVITLKSDNLFISLSDDANYKATFKANNASIDLYKDATVKLTGAIKKGRVRATGSPNIKAEDLKFNTLELTMENNSKAELFCETSIEIFLENKSKLELFGSSEIIIKGLKDESLIQKR